MQKGLSYPWLMRLTLSAAIALPTGSWLWLTLPARASESIQTSQSDAIALPQEAAKQRLSPPVAASPMPESSGLATPFLSQEPEWLAVRRADQPTQESTKLNQAVLLSAENGDSDLAAMAPRRVKSLFTSFVAPPFEVLLSQLEEGQSPLDELADPEGVEELTTPSDTSEPDVLDSEATDSEPVEDVLEDGDTGIDATDSEVLEDDLEVDDTGIDAPDPDAIDPEGTGSDLVDEDLEVDDSGVETLDSEGIDTDPLEEIDTGESDEIDSDLVPLEPEEDAEDVFSPLPESEVVDPEGDQPDLELDDALDDSNESVPTDLPGADDAPVLIPPERLLDSLEFLEPDPNPLLIQTEPEEVEIIGTQPLTLEEALELAYRNNPDLRVALLELEQARAALREARAELYPTVSLNGTLQGDIAERASNEIVQTPTGEFGGFESSSSEELDFTLSTGVDVVYNLYSSGLRGAQIRAVEEQLRLAELEVERRREELRLVTANEYYDLQAAIEAIRISQAFLDEAERNLRDTALREEVGVGTRFDVLRAEVQVANARQDLVNSQRARQVAQRSLVRRLNIPPSLTITTVPVDIAGTWPLGLEESIVLAFQNRAELEQQLTQRDINAELRNVALAALGPQVDVFANYNLSDTLTQSGSFTDRTSFGARVSWTLYEGGAAQARARQRELDIEIAERNFEEARNTIRLGVESAYYNLRANLTNIDTARLAVEQAQEALELAILRFDAGVGTQLDILNAQSELTDAEVNLVQAIVGYNRSLAELRRSVSNLPEPYYEEIPY